MGKSWWKTAKVGGKRLKSLDIMILKTYFDNDEDNGDSDAVIMKVMTVYIQLFAWQNISLG
jgi:hypothetical protein